jgi:AraC-like DNA-binding protein
VQKPHAGLNRRRRAVHAQNRSDCFTGLKFDPFAHTNYLYGTYSIREEAVCGDVFRSLRSERIAIRCRAAALLQSLLFAWWAAAGVPTEDNDRLRRQIQRLIEAMHHNPEKPWRLKEMAGQAGMSISSLRAAFHSTTGKPPARLRNEIRVAHAYEQLRRGDHTVAEVAEQLGYCDPFHFSKVFKTVYGFSPRAMRQRLR